MTKTILSMTACAAVLLASEAQALTATQKCVQAKLIAQGKLLACDAKWVSTLIDGTGAASPCFFQFSTALQKADTKAASSGTSCRYLNNGDGTVSDLNNGLMWEQKTNLDDVINTADPHDGDNIYTWSSSGSIPDGTVFSNFLYKLNGATSLDGTATSGCFAGHCDWRLPATEELRGLLLHAFPCDTSPCIDSVFTNTREWYFWSSTTLEGTPANAWTTFFQNGIVSNGAKTSSDTSVRAVRSDLGLRSAPIPGGTVTEHQCQKAKLKAQGKFQMCIKKNAAGLIGGKPDASAGCQTKFTAALQKADAKAASAGTSCRYILSLYSSVSDLNTGLQWEIKTGLDGSPTANPHDADNTYLWSAGPPYEPTGTVFTNFLYGLNSAMSPNGLAATGCLGGLCDWRLPIIEELRAIRLQATPCSITNPCIDPIFGLTGDLAWALTEKSFYSSAWIMGFGYPGGYDGLYYGSKDGPYQHNARAVRGGL